MQHRIPARAALRTHLLASAAILAGSFAWQAHRPAHAAAFQLKENTAVGLGTAFAGVGSSAEGANTVFNNPAGMVRLPGLQVDLGGSIIVPRAEFRGTATNALGQTISGASNRDGGDFALVPHGYVSYRITPDLAVGVAMTSPYGLATYYGPGFVGRYQAEETDLKTININPGIAYRIAPWLSVGAGFSAEYSRAQFSSSLNSSTIALQALGLRAALPDGYFRLKGDDWAFGYNLGVLIEPGPGTRIGLTYRSRIQHNFEGTASYNVPAPLSLSPNFRNSGGNAKLVLPDTASFSITQEIGPRLAVYGDVTWTNWSQFKNLNAFRDDGTLISSTPQRYHNSFFVAVGASYKVTDTLTLRAGTAFDKTPVENPYRTARVPDNDRYWLAIGASYRILPNVTLDGGYAHVFVRDARIDELSPTRDRLTGKYSNAIDIISLGARAQF